MEWLCFRVSIKDVEEREKKVVVLQESLIRRRKELERQHALRIQETEDVIARLQVLFGHEFCS